MRVNLNMSELGLHAIRCELFKCGYCSSKVTSISCATRSNCRLLQSDTNIEFPPGPCPLSLSLCVSRARLRLVLAPAPHFFRSALEGEERRRKETRLERRRRGGGEAVRQGEKAACDWRLAADLRATRASGRIWLVSLSSAVAGRFQFVRRQLGKFWRVSLRGSCCCDKLDYVERFNFGYQARTIATGRFQLCFRLLPQLRACHALSRRSYLSSECTTKHPAAR